MNKQFFVLLLLYAVTVKAVQTTHFFSDFDYETEPTGLLESIELNGAIGQIGTWGGDDFPEAAANGYFSGGVIGGDSAGFVDNPQGGRMLAIDQPIDSAVHFMELASSISTVGAAFSLSVGTLQNGFDGLADYDLFGLDDDGNESFRIRIGADNGTQRLGYVTNGVAKFDLPTLTGSDQINDLEAVSLPLSVVDDFANITLQLGNVGYVVSYDNFNFSNSYRTDLLPYNGNASKLSRIGLYYRGTEFEPPGFFLDDLRVTSGGDPPDPLTKSLIGSINSDQKIVLHGSGQTVVGMEFISEAGLLVPLATEDASPWEVLLANTANRISLGSFREQVTVEGVVVTNVGYTGLDPESELEVVWGDLNSNAFKVTVLNSSGDLVLDCNGDGIVDSGDLVCVCSTGASIDSLLDTLNLLEADLDTNGEVAFLDFLILADNFGEQGGYSHGDINCSGTVDFVDFLTLANNFGKSSAATSAAPEPDAGMLLMVGMTFGILVRIGRRRV